MRPLPIVRQPTSVITVPQRTAKVVCGYDVLVVGGGPSGLGAALGAADTGAQVALVEQYDFLVDMQQLHYLEPLQRITLFRQLSKRQMKRFYFHRITD